MNIETRSTTTKTYAATFISVLQLPDGFSEKDLTGAKSFLLPGDFFSDLRVVDLQISEGAVVVLTFIRLLARLCQLRGHTIAHRDIPSTAYILQVDADQLKTTIQSAIRLNLLQSNDDIFWSQDLITSLCTNYYRVVKQRTEASRVAAERRTQIAKDKRKHRDIDSPVGELPVTDRAPGKLDYINLSYDLIRSNDRSGSEGGSGGVRSLATVTQLPPPKRSVAPLVSEVPQLDGPPPGYTRPFPEFPNFEINEIELDELKCRFASEGLDPVTDLKIAAEQVHLHYVGHREQRGDRKSWLHVSKWAMYRTMDIKRSKRAPADAKPKTSDASQVAWNELYRLYQKYGVSGWVKQIEPRLAKARPITLEVTNALGTYKKFRDAQAGKTSFIEAEFKAEFDRLSSQRGNVAQRSA